jgi:hypothetical protein
VPVSQRGWLSPSHVSQRRPKWCGKPSSYVIFPICSHWCVDSDDKCLKPCPLDPFDKRGDCRRLTRQIGLEPGLRVCRHDFFERNQRRSAHDHRNAGCRGCFRQNEITPVGHQCREPQGRDPERSVELLRKQRGCHAATCDVDHHSRHETILVECETIASQRRIRLSGAGDISKQRPRKMRLGRGFEIVKAQDASQPTGHDRLCNVPNLARHGQCPVSRQRPLPYAARRRRAARVSSAAR